MSTTTDLWGQDIALDAAGIARIAASGEMFLTDGVDTGLQDICLRLFTRLGTLFYDTEFGSLIHDWILEESTDASRAAFCSEVVMRVEADPRVIVGSVRSTVLNWDDRSLSVSVGWRFIDVDHASNLILQYNKVTHELVISDVKPHSVGISAYLKDDR